ncbi:unnamed protein product [Phyllotreta striolata]|uniref:Gustatory receptor n=1 Tax=Phyllotreta striolata TaxID=444603 RepID=A0A9N9XPQ1_PHYSR|nr:unnamed protein product [Phyllotreta striolata]
MIYFAYLSSICAWFVAMNEMKQCNRVASFDGIMHGKLLTMARFMGVVPFSIEKSTNSKMYVVFLILVYASVEVWQIKVRISETIIWTNYMSVISDTFQFINENIIMASVFSSSLAREEHWLKFFHRMKIFEDLNPEEDIGVFVKFAEYAPIGLFFWMVANDSFQIIYYTYSTETITPYLTFYVSNTYIIFTSVVLCEMAGVIEKFQMNLNADFSLLNKRKNFLCESLIKLFRSKITLISRFMININALFGWNMLTLFIVFIISILNFITTSFIRLKHWSLEMELFAITDVIRIVMFSIDMLLVMSKCDRIQKHNDNFVLNCYYLQEGMPNSRIREELMHLAQYSEKLAPKFSAVGFFVVNRLIIGAMFSSITTYLIVCIQFNLSSG